MAAAHPPLSKPIPEEVEQALDEILASPHFRNSAQCSNFLRYVVKHSLAEESHLLRERVIGHEVFHRAPDYETGEDPVVRIRAAEVRKRLAQFYQNGSTEVLIDIPSGSYRAVFLAAGDTARPPVPRERPSRSEMPAIPGLEGKSWALADPQPADSPAPQHGAAAHTAEVPAPPPLLLIEPEPVAPPQASQSHPKPDSEPLPQQRREPHEESEPGPEPEPGQPVPRDRTPPLAAKAAPERRAAPAPTLQPEPVPARTQDHAQERIQDSREDRNQPRGRLRGTGRAAVRGWSALLAVAVAAAVGAAYLAGSHGAQERRAEAQLWQPWTAAGHPVLIAMGSNAVYRLRDGIVDQYVQDHSLPGSGVEVFPAPADVAHLPGGSFQQAENSFVALGDVSALADFVAVLTQQGQHFQERFPNDISFAELRENPTILIGGYNNPTSIELTRNLRFRLTGHNEIDDTATPGRHWSLHASLDSHETEDYAILTRIVRQGTDAPLLAVAGMGQYGTQSAAEFITAPGAMNHLEAQLGKGWELKNFQLVLHVRIHNFKPAPAEVVTSYSW